MGAENVRTDGSDSSGASATTEGAEEAIQHRLKALSKQVVKTALETRQGRLQDDGSDDLQTLPSQDIQYLENRVENLASKILDNVLPISRAKASKENSAGDETSRLVSARSTSSSVSTLPEDYDVKANAMTMRIIKTLLNLKKMMPHPKPRTQDKSGKTTAATIASCTNFDALYNAPKEAFTLNKDEIAGLAQAMTERLNVLDDASTPEPQVSPRDGLVGELCNHIVDGIGLDKMSPRSDRISTSGSESQLAFKIVQNVVKKGDYGTQHVALSEGGVSLADKIVNGQIANAQEYVENSAESMFDDMAREAHELATELLKAEDGHKSSSDTDSVDGIADRLAGLIVDYGQEQYLKESLDKKADIISKEVSDIAHGLIRELLMSAKAGVSEDGETRSQKSASSYRKVCLSNSNTTTATLELAFSEAIGALTNTVIKSHPSSDHVTRTHSEVALRRLLQVLQNSYTHHDDDAASRGSSAASCLADDLASTVIGTCESAMNQVCTGTMAKPDLAEAKGTQVEVESIDDQANKLLESILNELRVSEPTESVQSSELLTPNEITSFENEDDAATQISKVLVQRLVPHLIEHFKPPPPPPSFDAQTSCFKDFRKTGIYKKRFRPQDYTSTESNSDLPSAESTLSSAEELSQEASSHRMMTKLDRLAMNIVTDTVKDDRIHNVKKADEIHSLVQDLALGIVDTLFIPGSRAGSKPSSPEKAWSRGNSPQKRYRKKTSTPASRETPRQKLGKHEDPEAILARALRRTSSNSSLGGGKFKPKPPTTPKRKNRITCVDKLANQIVDNNFERKSGSSKTTSGASHNGSDIDAMSYALCRDLPKTVDVSDTTTSADEKLADAVVPRDMEMSPTSDSDALVQHFINGMVETSMVDGEDTRSMASSLAEELVAKSWKAGAVSTKTGESSVAERMIAQSMVDAAAPSSYETELASDLVKETIDGAAVPSSHSTELASDLVNEGMDNAELPSEGSSLAEVMIAESVHVVLSDSKSERSSIAERIIEQGVQGGTEKALSKSPTSSVAEDIIGNLSPFAGSESPDETLADDILEHVLCGIPEKKQE